MISAVDQLFAALVRGSIAMLIVWILLRLARPQALYLQRIVCIFVLIQGWLLAPWTIEVPWYQATPVQNTEEKTNADPETSRETHPPNPTRVNPSPVVAASTADRSPTAPLKSLLILVWLAGTCLILLQVLRNAYRLLSESRRWTLAPPTWNRMWLKLLSQHNIHRPIPMYVSQTHGPMICRLPQQLCLVVPEWFWETCDESQRALILRHELSHCRHHDLETGWCIGALALPYWFHPATWWAVSTWQQTAELRADREATGSDDDRVEFLRVLERLAVGRPPAIAWLGQSAHQHPLLRRMSSLVKGLPQEDSKMRIGITYLLLLGLLFVQTIRVELVAQETSPPLTVAAIKASMQALDAKIESLSGIRETLKSDAATLKEDVDAKVASLEALAKDPSQISAAGKERAQRFHRNTEADQLEALKDIQKHEPRDEAILFCGRAAKESEFASVRQAAMKAACALGKDGYAAIAIAFENLNTEDKILLLEQSRNFDPKDRSVIIAMMAKDANSDLISKLIAEPLADDRRLAILSGLAESIGDSAIKQIIETAEATSGEQGLLILYAAAKSNQSEHVLAAVKAARKRGAIAYPVIGAAGKCEDLAVRTEIVRAARAWGGEVGEYIIDKATSDPNESLRNAAKEAVIE